MTLYRWDSTERRFTSTSDRIETPASDSALRERHTEKGQRTRPDVATGDLCITMLKGAWQMQIANSELTVRDNEAVIIPSGFSHSAEAIEDSVALETSEEQNPSADDSRWAV